MVWPRRDRMVARTTASRITRTCPPSGSSGSPASCVVAALVGGTIIGSVAASTLSEATSPAPVAPEPAAAASAQPAAAEYCAAFRRAFASKLGVDESALAPAAKAAAIAAIADAVADGRMTKAAGDRLTARVDAAAADGCALLAGKVRALMVAGGSAGGLGVVRDGLTAAAKALGMTPAEVGARLRAGRVPEGPRDHGRHAVRDDLGGRPRRGQGGSRQGGRRRHDPAGAGRSGPGPGHAGAR